MTIGTVLFVGSVAELRSAFQEANQSGGNMTILIEDGIYPIASTASYPYLTASNLVIRSSSGNRDAVIITGQGMQAVNGTEIGLSLQGDNITVADLTIRDVGNHGISMNSNNHLIHNVKIQNTFEQMIKGTSSDGGSDNCIVQCSLLEYPAGIGPQWYIGGLDIHDGDNWIVRDNVFKNIASPSGSVAEHAVHFWNSSSNNIVERNLIYNCDRGVGFGLGDSPNQGGIIRNNMITNDGSGPYNDVGIGLETSPDTEVYNNTILISYPNAIEYRFVSSSNIKIKNNLTNKLITSRNGGSADAIDNYTNAIPTWFIDPSSGDLRLFENRSEIIDQGSDLVQVQDDIDQVMRPQGNGIDLGAHEWTSGFIVDQDGDGFNSDEDCDDTSADINPDAVEIANNDIDENCDGELLIIDADGDGFNSDEDCDDMNADVNPDASEIANNDLDENCDGELLIIDEDGDGFNSDQDCDDTSADINPEAEEIANNDVDENCDGELLIIDEDGDGFNSDEDCDDMNAEINPDANEVANNETDENCDGEILVIDEDGDGFNSDEDCDDLNADINPDAEDIPDNNIDEDCDGEDLMTSHVNSTYLTKISISPNPASDVIILKQEAADEMSVSIYDVNGREMENFIINSPILEKSIVHLPNGLYIIEIVGSQLEKAELHKLVKTN